MKKIQEGDVMWFICFGQAIMEIQYNGGMVSNDDFCNAMEFSIKYWNKNIWSYILLFQKDWFIQANTISPINSGLC